MPGRCLAEQLVSSHPREVSWQKRFELLDVALPIATDQLIFYHCEGAARSQLKVAELRMSQGVGDCACAQL